MSRAVIDQAGFRVFFIGFLLSLILGLALRAQIAPARVKTLLQDSVSRLDKDFIIDFDSAEVVLSNWGLLLPSLQISNIRVSPKKSICQESQIFIENLSLPLSLTSLVTSESLITEVNASRVELRVADLNHCFGEDKKIAPPSKRSASDNNTQAVVAEGRVVKNEATGNDKNPASAEKVPEKNIFQTNTAALLQKINIDQLKLISKKYPTQPIDFRHLIFELGYENNQLNKIDISSQMYALTDAQSDVTYFKGDLGVQVFAKKSQQIEAIVKLNGRLLDGEIKFFALVNSVEKNIKLDIKADNVALKPLIQLKLVESSLLNFPMTFNFRGYGFYQYDTNQFTELKLNDIEIAGERTKITIDELAAKTEKNKLQVMPFKADVQKLNLNKIVNLSQNKNVSQSIENLGEFTGSVNFKNPEHIEVNGKWTDLEFIFANRGYRELQKIDSFDLQAKLDADNAQANLSQFVLNQKAIKGDSEFSYNLDSGYIQAKADLEGPILNDKVWSLLTQVPQSPNINVHWNYKKTKDERHQVNLLVDQVSTFGLKLENLELNFIQTIQDGLSSGVVLSAKSNKIDITPDDLKINIVTQLFNSKTDLNEKNYAAEAFHMNLKGMDWRTMSFEMDSQLKTTADMKSIASVKAKGDWSENDFISGTLSLQGNNKNTRYQLIKTPNNELGISEQ